MEAGHPECVGVMMWRGTGVAGMIRERQSRLNFNSDNQSSYKNHPPSSWPSDSKTSHWPLSRQLFIHIKTSEIKHLCEFCNEIQPFSEYLFSQNWLFGAVLSLPTSSLYSKVRLIPPQLNMSLKSYRNPRKECESLWKEQSGWRWRAVTSKNSLLLFWFFCPVVFGIMELEEYV